MLLTRYVWDKLWCFWKSRRPNNYKLGMGYFASGNAKIENNFEIDGNIKITGNTHSNGAGNTNNDGNGLNPWVQPAGMVQAEDLTPKHLIIYQDNFNINFTQMKKSILILFSHLHFQ